MRSIMFNQLTALDDTIRYPGMDLNKPESGASHSCYLGLISVYVVGDMLDYVSQYPDCKDINIDLSNVAIRALFYNLNIHNYDLGGMSKEAKYYAYDLKSKLNLAFLYPFWRSMNDGSVENHILQLSYFLTVLRKCIEEIESYGNTKMISVANELKEHLLLEHENLSVSKTLLNGFRLYLLDAYTKCISMVDDLVKSPSAPAQAPEAAPVILYNQEKSPAAE